LQLVPAARQAIISQGGKEKEKVPREKRATGRAVAYIAALQELMDILACCWQNAYLAATAGVAADPPAWCAKTRSRVLPLVFGAAASSRAPLPSASPVQCLQTFWAPAIQRVQLSDESYWCSAGGAASRGKVFPTRSFRRELHHRDRLVELSPTV
jgi:hypothetical protein